MKTFSKQPEARSSSNLGSSVWYSISFIYALLAEMAPTAEALMKAVSLMLYIFKYIP